MLNYLPFSLKNLFHNSFGKKKRIRNLRKEIKKRIKKFIYFKKKKLTLI